MLVIFGADYTRDDNVYNDRDAYENTDDQIDKRTRRADGGLCQRAVDGIKLTDNDKVGGIENKLQNTRQNNGYREQQHIFYERALKQVFINGFLRHSIPPLLKSRRAKEQNEK